MSGIFFEKLTNACHDLLLDNEGLMHYLKAHRGINDETIGAYKLGAFPEDLRELYDRHGIDPVQLREHDIVWNASNSPFRLHPLIIPIRDVQGTPIAIGGRTLLTDERREDMGIPKYRNSSYRKTAHLFGLDRALSAIREKDFVAVVEGYFDVLTAHQKNVMNVVATCGTIFHERQLIMLSRYTNNICLLFDNDAAGHRSARNVMSKLEGFDGDLNLMYKFTPDGYKDLDEYLQKDGDISRFFGEERVDLNDVEVKTLW